MPIQPNDRHQQDIQRIRRGGTAGGGFPTRLPYRGHRAGSGALSWHELNELPVGGASRHHNTH
ncbi:hypothetical protein KIF24_22980 [Micromonospora sp. Llam7]|uniref:hypothetical protein n=1 Tax=Micromonospora tarapacensis TaxID=2835305 RepID=UPI001C82ACCD|nr:hypothetical protein [Micromonospora tarapacensis]MBX7268598.1 hypothetical protein [Micromonospora tarapacensis]